MEILHGNLSPLQNAQAFREAGLFQIAEGKGEMRMIRLVKSVGVEEFSLPESR